MYLHKNKNVHRIRKYQISSIKQFSKKNCVPIAKGYTWVDIAYNM